MDPHWRHPYGLRPTLRQMMILVVHSALLSALVRLLNYGFYAGLVVAIPLSPPLLSLLVASLDRPSPAKYWLAGLLAALFLPSLVLAFDVGAATAWWYDLDDNGGILLFLPVLNVVGLISLLRAAWRLPRHCPECGFQALLPLGRRSAALFWCASCGFRERAGRPEATH